MTSGRCGRARVSRRPLLEGELIGLSGPIPQPQVPSWCVAPRTRSDPMRSRPNDDRYTCADLEREFPDDAACLDWLWRQNHSSDGGHADCPKCGRQRRFHRVRTRPSYSCDSCGYHLHPTSGTIFHKSSTGLDTWFKAVVIMGSTRCGVSAKQLQRELGVTYKTAWRMAKLIRQKLMAPSR